MGKLATAEGEKGGRKEEERGGKEGVNYALLLAYLCELEFAKG